VLTTAITSIVFGYLLKVDLRRTIEWYANERANGRG